MSPILETHNVFKRYNGAAEPAVKDLSFAVREGEIFSLLGPNGAGKTTTLSILSGLLAPSAGEAYVGGHEVQREPRAVKSLIGVVPQEIALYPTLTARENLLFWGRMHSMGGERLAHRVEKVLEIVGLSERARERVETYSGGMQRRINIAVGLLHEPRLIFMDEPTVGIDPQSRRNILDTVKELNRQGITVLYTTHYMEEAQELSHRIGIIDHGEMIALGSLGELTRLIDQADVIELQLEGPGAPPALIPALTSIPGVQSARTENGTLKLLADDANASLPAIIQAANDHAIRLAGMEIQEPNLEAVFLQLTGRALRDG